MAGAPRADPFNIAMGPSVPSAGRGVVDCALVGIVVERYDDGEARAVGGVGWACGFFRAPDALNRAGALKTDELALVWELADPPVLSVSPVRDSESSARGCAARGPVPLMCDLDAKPV